MNRWSKFLMAFLFIFLPLSPVINVEAASLNATTIKETDALNVASKIKDNYNDSEFGGMYIDDEGNLHVFLLDDQNKFYNSLRNLEKENKIKIESAKYSRQFLIDNSVLLADMLCNKGLVFKKIYLDEALNKVKVILSKEHEYPNDVLDFLNKDIFKVSYEPYERENITKEINVSPGYKVDDYYSITCMVKRSGVIGFLTAGHCIAAGEAMYSTSGTLMATGTVSYDSGSMDAAFATRYNSSYVPSSVATYSGYRIKGFDSSKIVQGASIHLEGATSGHQLGEIISTSHIIQDTDTGFYYSHRILSTYTSALGDSGGTLWVGQYNAATGVYEGYIVGIHNGATYGNPYGTRIDIAVNNMGITYYG